MLAVHCRFFTEGLRAFQATNNTLPDRIFFYRDGVSDGELEQLKSVEIEKIKEAFAEIGQGYTYAMLKCYCCIQETARNSPFAYARIW